MNRIIKLLILMIIIVVSDQITKRYVQSNMSVGESIQVISGFFNITYVRNPGAAFGFLAEASEKIRKPLFLALPVIACFWLVWLIWDSRKRHPILTLAYGLIMAGAVGNLIDRFSLGYVIDFFDFYYSIHHYPAFNIADSSITVAAILLIIEFIFLSKKNTHKIKR